METQTVKYLRLMDDDNTQKVIDFIKNNDVNDYANITIGGVSMHVADENWNVVTEYIKSLGVRFEITLVHPYKVEQNIVRNLKNGCVL